MDMFKLICVATAVFGGLQFMLNFSKEMITYSSLITGHYKDITLEDRISVMTSVGFAIGLLFMFIKAMTLISKVLDGKTVSSKVEFPDTVKMLKRNFQNLMEHSAAFFFVYSFYMLNMVATGDELKEAFAIGLSWVFFRIVYIFASFIGRDIDLKAIKMFGMVPSMAIIVYFCTLSLGYKQSMQWVYHGVY